MNYLRAQNDAFDNQARILIDSAPRRSDLRLLPLQFGSFDQVAIAPAKTRHGMEYTIRFALKRDGTSSSPSLFRRCCFSGHLGGCLDFWPSTVRTKSLLSFVSATLRPRLHAPS
jgi:hypothetical protein